MKEGSRAINLLTFSPSWVSLAPFIDSLTASISPYRGMSGFPLASKISAPVTNVSSKSKAYFSLEPKIFVSCISAPN